MVTTSSPNCLLVIGGISSEPAATAATASHDTNNVNHSYTKQAPSLKTIERIPADYNPNRIPASVFSNKPSNLTDWSMASNDSVFSIRMGPSNSTKDITLPEEIKPPPPPPPTEEVVVSHDSSNSFFSLPALTDDDEQNGEMISSSSSSSRSSSSDEDEEEEEEDGSETGEMVKPELTKIIVEKTTTEEGVRNSRVSDDDDDKETRCSDTARSSATKLSGSSWNSKTSFAFPILEANNKKGRNESKNVTIKIPPAVITAHKEPQQPAAPPQTDMIAADRTRTRWFCCCSFKFPIFCCCS